MPCRILIPVANSVGCWFNVDHMDVRDVKCMLFDVFCQLTDTFTCLLLARARIQNCVVFTPRKNLTRVQVLYEWNTRTKINNIVHILQTKAKIPKRLATDSLYCLIFLTPNKQLKSKFETSSTDNFDISSGRANLACILHQEGIRQ